MQKKQKVFYTLLLMAAVIVVVLWFGHPRSFDDLADIPDDVSITASYWLGANSYIGAEWEHGSPEAQHVLELLRGTTYSRSLLHELLFRERRISQTINGNSGMLTLVLQGGSGGKYVIGLWNGTVSFYGNDGFSPKNGDLYDELVAMVTEAAK